MGWLIAWGVERAPAPTVEVEREKILGEGGGG